MLCYSLTTAEGAGDGCNTAFGNGEECVDNTLPCYQQRVGCFFYFVRTFLTNGPFLHHRYFDVFALFVCNDTNGFFYGKLTDIDFFDGTFYAIRNHDTAFYYRCFLYFTDDVACFYNIADLACGFKFPFLFSVQRRCFYALMNVCAADFIQLFQRTLNPIINGGNQTRAQFNAHGHASGNHFFTGAQTGGFFINLNGRSVPVHFDDFTNQVFIGYTHHVKHIGFTHVFCDDQWA